MTALYLFIIVILVVFLVLLGLAKLILFMAFGKRCDGNPNLKYLTAEDFEGLSARPIEFKSNKNQTIRGNIYTYKDIKEFKSLIVFCHGMGAGHLSYTTEINTLAKAGYMVLSYDNTGTCTSEGKGLNGLFQAVIDLKYALKFVEENEELSKYEVKLVGHSWGAYTVCQVLQFNANVKAVVSLSSFDNSADLICNSMKAETNANFAFIKPFLNIVNFLSFGRKAIKETSKVLENTKVPVLLLHGDLDTSVPLANSPISKENLISKNKNIKTIIYENKYHNVYQTRDSEKYLNSVFGKISELNKKYKGKAPAEEISKVYSNIDYKKITEEDEEVMNTIIDFLG